MKVIKGKERIWAGVLNLFQLFTPKEIKATLYNVPLFMSCEKEFKLKHFLEIKIMMKILRFPRGFHVPFVARLTQFENHWIRRWKSFISEQKKRLSPVTNLYCSLRTRKVWFRLTTTTTAITTNVIWLLKTKININEFQSGSLGGRN